MIAPKALVFDVNETLLDISPMSVAFESVFGPDPPLGEWFARLLHGSLVANQMDDYRPFSLIGVEVLTAMATKRGVALGHDRALAIVSGMAGLPAHPDVIPALERVSTAGLKTAALTNGDREMADSQIDNAGLRPYLGRVISVDEVGRFKPDPAPYRHAASAMGVDLADLMLVAAHDWDVAGAIDAGLRGAFVRRRGGYWSVPRPEPVLVAPDLVALADALGVG